MGRLFWKFFLSILLAQLSATVGIGGAFWLQDRARQQKTLELDTSPPARMAIDAAAATLEFGGTAALRSLLAGMDRHHVLALDESGHEVLNRSVDPLMLAEARAILGQDGARRTVRELTGADGHRYLLFLPSEERGPRFGPGLAHGPGPFAEPGPVRFGAPPPGPALDPRYRAFIPLAAATLASLLFAVLLAWYFSRPIRALRLAFEAASGGDLTPRFAGKGGRRGDELSSLGHDFDRMTGRLRSLIDGQTRLLHDVSHELRSPLARLQAAIGLAHQRPDQVATSLDRIERECVRMDKLVGELLTLSRLEAGAQGALSEDIYIADLIEDIVGDGCFEAAARNVAVTLVGEADIRVIGHADLLGRALENVLRNAIKHSPAGSTVRLELGIIEDGRQLRVAVLDSGPGVAATDLQAIFKPFFRAGSEHTTDGHGLGLAIARQVVLAHRGSIIASNRGEGGLSVEIVLPIAPGGVPTAKRGAA